MILYFLPIYFFAFSPFYRCFPNWTAKLAIFHDITKYLHLFELKLAKIFGYFENIV